MLEIYGLAKCWKYVDWPNAGNILNGPTPVSNEKGACPFCRQHTMPQLRRVAQGCGAWPFVFLPGFYPTSPRATFWYNFGHDFGSFF